MGVFFERRKRRYQPFEVRERRGADFIARRMIQRDFDRAVLDLPRKRLAAKASSFRVFFSYIASISAANRAAMASRFSLPLAVSRPFSMLNASPSNVEGSDLLVVRHARVHRVERRLNALSPCVCRPPAGNRQ